MPLATLVSALVMHGVKMHVKTLLLEKLKTTRGTSQTDLWRITEFYRYKYL